jgi:hypothetical protein
VFQILSCKKILQGDSIRTMQFGPEQNLDMFFTYLSDVRRRTKVLIYVCGVIGSEIDFIFARISRTFGDGIPNQESLSHSRSRDQLAMGPQGEAGSRRRGAEADGRSYPYPYPCPYRGGIFRNHWRQAALVPDHPQCRHSPARPHSLGTRAVFLQLLSP